MAEASVRTQSDADVRQPFEKRHARLQVARIIVDPDQPRREFDEPSITELSENMLAVGQLCPVIGYADPADPTRLVLVDGERRYRAARRAGIDALDAIVLPAKPNPIELLLSQLSVNNFRAGLTSRELCAAYAKLLADLGLTQGELASRLGVSESKISKALARNRIAPEFQPLADRLETSVVPVIAKLAADRQAEALAFATTPTSHGKLPTRHQVEVYLEAMKPKRTAARNKTLSGTWDQRTVRIGLKPADTHDSLIESLKALVGFIQKNRNIPVANLDLILT